MMGSSQDTLVYLPLLVTDEAVAVTIGGTILTDLTSLLVLAVCLPIHGSGFSTSAFLLQIVEMVAYVVLAFFGLSALGRWLLERMGDSRDKQVVLILLIIAVAGFGAEAINLEPIIESGSQQPARRWI